MLGKKKQKKIINIEGMHCEHCAKNVERTLSSIDNVLKVKVNLNKKQAEITYENELNKDIIINKIEDLNFKVTEIK